MWFWCVHCRPKPAYGSMPWYAVLVLRPQFFVKGIVLIFGLILDLAVLFLYMMILIMNFEMFHCMIQLESTLCLFGCMCRAILGSWSQTIFWYQSWPMSILFSVLVLPIMIIFLDSALLVLVLRRSGMFKKSDLFTPCLTFSLLYRVVVMHIFLRYAGSWCWAYPAFSCFYS